MQDFAAIVFETANNERSSVCSVGVVNHRSSRARKFHPHPLTEPCVKVSPHTALHTQLFVHRHNTNGFASFIISSSLFKSCIIPVA